MIPKILHFIWLGDRIPSYAEFCMNSFHEVNPDFKINFIHDTIKNPQNEDVKDILKLIKDESTFYYKMFNRPWAKRHLQSYNGIMSNVADCLRCYILNKYGGIYLDLDTFPVNPFDNKLLNHKNFIVKHREKTFDIFFIGSEIGKTFDDFIYYNEKTKNYHIKNPDKIIYYYEWLRNFHRKEINIFTEKFINRDL